MNIKIMVFCFIGVLGDPKLKEFIEYLNSLGEAISGP